MSGVRHGALRRWSLVAGGVAALCLLPWAVGRWPAAGVRTDPETLRGRILASAGRPYQGYVDSRGRIGLPNLPQAGDVSGLFGGSTSIRVWYASAQAWRVAVVDPVGEKDVYRTAAGTYVWDFGRNLLTEVVGDLPVRLPWAADVVPPDLARRLLAAAAPGDPVRAIGSRRVAGVPAAGLRLTSTDPDTTLDAVDVWADPVTGLPLRVEVTARGSAEPVFTSTFLDVAQRAPGADVLTPRWASTAGFTSTSEPDVAAALNGAVSGTLPAALAGHARVADPGGVTGVAAYGQGFSRFAVVPLPGRLGSQVLNAFRDAGGAPMQLTAGQGYTVRAGVLTTVVMRTPGDRSRRRTYLLAGLVTPELLGRVAAELLAGSP